MSGGFDKNQTIQDYTIILWALLPGFMAFYCHDRRGIRFFEQPAAEVIEFSTDYDDAVKRILADPEQAATFGQVDLGLAVAYIIPFTGDHSSVLGVFSILVQPDEAKTYDEIVDQVYPVVNSLQRELSLRYRLMAAYKQLNTRSAEENLLHQIEKVVYLRRTSDDTLTHILLLCRKFLKVAGT
ncbi:MAG: hypothetical protein QGG54_02955 [Gammaproteobacteria bacterium]|jgi:hypothetical protein|nr:hypothetical protein [Chromatiales bacterium]MDP6413981.1 hypothetical protein [Gammaproteobacteria bacterium]MDP6673832.1 hypothetical protein [Gammaproteobacteria bacterium]